jgi:hypothetical protein
MPPGNAYGYMSIAKLMGILQLLQTRGAKYISTGFNSLPVMTVFNADLEQIGIIEPHRESYSTFTKGEDIGPL